MLAPRIESSPKLVLNKSTASIAQPFSGPLRQREKPVNAAMEYGLGGGTKQSAIFRIF